MEEPEGGPRQPGSLPEDAAGCTAGQAVQALTDGVHPELSAGLHTD